MYGNVGAKAKLVKRLFFFFSLGLVGRHGAVVTMELRVAKGNIGRAYVKT